MENYYPSATQLEKWAEEKRRAQAEANARLQTVWDKHFFSESDFLKWADTYYNYRLCSFNTSKDGIIGWLFKYGKDLQLLSGSFAEFRDRYLENPGRNRPRRYWLRRRGEYWYTAHGVDFHQRMGYRGGADKKQLSEKEVFRREWRERKQLHRDKAKGRGWYGGNRKNWAQKSSNRSERRYVRQCLQQQKEIKYTHRWFNDPWMWD